MIKKGKIASLVLFAATVIIACSKNGSPEPDKTQGSAADRQLMLVNISDNIVIPSYDNFKLKFDLMIAKGESFTTTPNSATLNDFRTAWKNAYIEWQKVELFEFGPAERYVLRSYFNVYPVTESVVQANINSGTANLDLPANFNAQGFPAIDYLINGLGTDDNAIISFYTTAPDAAKRITYLKKITNQMNTVFSLVYNEWKGAYRNQFINTTGVDASSSTSTMVNGFVRNYERSIRSGKFGIPSGIMVNGTVSPERVEAFYKKDISLTLAKAAHKAAVEFFNGKSVKDGSEGPSLKTYLSALSAIDSKTKGSLPQAINSQFDLTSQKLDAINTDNLNSVVLTNNQVMIDIYNEMQKSVRMLKVDMTSAMSITITYTDNDGD